MTIIEPTVGRIVWYRPRAEDEIPHFLHDEPLAAMVAGVEAEDHVGFYVNLAVFGRNGSGPYARERVLLAQDRAAEKGECCWMPYQKGQAAKTEAVAEELRKLNQPMQAQPLIPIRSGTAGVTPMHGQLTTDPPEQPQG